MIEDTQTSFWPNWGGSLADGGQTFKLARALMDSLNFAEAAVVNPNLKIDKEVKTIRSLRAFHNLIVVEKGNNDEPSNFAYDLRNPFAVHAVETIVRELKRAPTASGYANLISVYTMGKDFSAALKVAEESLARWPDHPFLLAAAAGAYAAAGDAAQSGKLRERLNKIQ